MHPQVVVLLAVASLIVAAPLDDNSNPYFDRIFDNQLAATEHPSYMTYSLVDRGVPYSGRFFSSGRHDCELTHSRLQSLVPNPSWMSSSQRVSRQLWQGKDMAYLTRPARI